MMFSDQIMTTLISAFSALSIVLIKDIILQKQQEQRSNRRTLLQARIEQAYAPLEFLAYQIVRTDDTTNREHLTTEIEKVLRYRSYLLSEATVSAFYVLLENTNEGSRLLQEHFYTEFLELKATYYRLWDTEEHARQQKTLTNNRPTDNYLGGTSTQLLGGHTWD